MEGSDALGLAARTQYEEAFEATRSREITRSVADLRGDFSLKTVKGRAYWHFRFVDLAGVQRSLYLGPDGDRLRALVAAAHERPGLSETLKPIGLSAIAYGCTATDTASFRIVERLGAAGLFRAGAVLVGTHAFVALGNHLGVRWRADTRTRDVDFPHPGTNLSIALPGNVTTDVHGAIESLEMGFVPLDAMASFYGSRTDPNFRIDFLTVLHKGGVEVVRPEHLNVALQRLRFMEYLLESPIQAVLLARVGTALVNVPAPERYAFHKLLVSAERWARRDNAKAVKDLAQAASLIDTHVDQMQEAMLEDALEDLLRRGPGWRRRLRESMPRLSKWHPGAASWLERRLPAASARRK